MAEERKEPLGDDCARKLPLKHCCTVIDRKIRATASAGLVDQKDALDMYLHCEARTDLSNPAVQIWFEEALTFPKSWGGLTWLRGFLQSL